MSTEIEITTGNGLNLFHFLVKFTVVAFVVAAGFGMLIAIAFALLSN